MVIAEFKPTILFFLLTTNIFWLNMVLGMKSVLLIWHNDYKESVAFCEELGSMEMKISKPLNLFKLKYIVLFQ